MANELGIAHKPGLTYLCDVRQPDGTLVDSTVVLSENGATGVYYGDMPSAPAGEYDVFYYSSGVYYGTERINWDGTKAIGFLDVPTAKTIWSYATRTLTSSANVTSSSVSGSRIEIVRDATFINTWSGLTIPATWGKCYFTVKCDSDTELDDQALIQAVVTNGGGVTDGLLRINGGAATAANGSLVVDEGAGTVVVTVADDATAELIIFLNAEYDLKFILTGGGSELSLRKGFADIVSTPTRAIA